MSQRTRWHAPSLAIKNEPLLFSLIKYRLRRDRWPSTMGWANLISSRTDDGKQMPILDLDFPHRIEKSSTPGHSHLYLDTPMSQWRWIALMIGLRVSNVVEPGYFIWSMRRQANFVRPPGLQKSQPEEFVKPEYGWVRKLRRN